MSELNIEPTHYYKELDGKYYPVSVNDATGKITACDDDYVFISRWPALRNVCETMTAKEYEETFGKVNTGGDIVPKDIKEPEYQFKVGDYVKVTSPEVVLEKFKDHCGHITHVEEDEDGEQCFTIKFLEGGSQYAYSKTDGVVLVEEAEVAPDNVKSPAHYGQGSIEAITYIEDFLTKEEYIGYLRGNIAKYLHRFRYKGKPVEDLHKARVYLEWLIETVEEEELK